jgi:ubiquitin-activating enzyme E1 C
MLAQGPFNEFPEEYLPQQAAELLRSSRVLVIGAGGLGCEILKDLALTGFKHIEVIDMDTIDVSNLNRQFLFRQRDVGRPKADVAAEFIRRRMRHDARLTITPHFCRIQDKPPAYYAQFEVVICGLDSVEARRWINATLVGLADAHRVVPMVDGGTEGFRGQARVIIPTLTLCYECLLDMLSTRTTYPVCTIANTPRLPEHCVEWASQLEWGRHFPHTKFDSDNAEHVDWMYATALARAALFGIEGVTRSLTLGVVKHIIPAIAATNAVVAAACCNEAFKLATSVNPVLSNYMMYLGDDQIFTYTFAHTRKPSCAVCGTAAKRVRPAPLATLAEFIDGLARDPEIQLKRPLLTTALSQLYLHAPPVLERLTRANLARPLAELVTAGEEIVVTDPALPILLRVVVEGWGTSPSPPPPTD